ncbi:4-carboxy-4-hydroxy-2-oxoadipate aldolase/oxaloacetate decarboxylase [Pseudonocardia xishanensis]|uniref:Putative 4-hydroxy-4-methyl-2-oxoglutarate aldolase n=1 Tax=Pseudonocardia xishanensis TaxID=630995 RepID=A0ABP8RTL4_9PSEU
MTDVVEQFTRLDACTVSDACDALGIDAVAPGLAALWAGAAVCGRAVTVRLAEVDPENPPRTTVHLGVEAIERSAPGDVIVVANEGRTGMGGWGGLLSRAALRKGVAGVVVDGACRDIDEARQQGFPVFGLAGTPRTARGRVHQVECGGVVTVAGRSVEPGDVVVADGSGVVVVPAAQAGPVLHRAEQIAAREAEMVRLLDSGLEPSGVLGGAYEDMLRRA